MALSDWLFATTGQTHQFALERLFDLLYRGLVEILSVAEPAARCGTGDGLSSERRQTCARIRLLRI
jgi:hypothetical protein